MVFRRVIWLLVNLDTPVFRGDGQPERTLLANERTSATRQGRGKPSPYYTRAGRLARPSRVGAIPCGRPVYGHHRVVLAFASNVSRPCKDTPYLSCPATLHRPRPYGWGIYDKWGCERVAPQVSIGNRTRATMKALPAAPHLPRPYGGGFTIGESYKGRTYASSTFQR